MAYSPKTYVMELGLDADAAPRTDGTYPLLESLARKDSKSSAGWVPAWETEFRSGDIIAFRVFDYTLDATKSRFALKNLSLFFLDPAHPAALSSCLHENPICVSEHSFLPTPPKSLVVPDAPGWGLADTTGAEAFFTFDTPERSILRVGIITTYQVEPGRHELRQFGHDPEIFVGEGSGTFPPNSPRRR